MAFLIGVLSACNQVEDILGKVNQLLDEQLDEEQDSEEGTEDSNQEDSTSDEVVDVDPNQNLQTETTDEDAKTVDNKPDAQLPFDERLAEQGYDTLVLPNGFPFEVPYHWILVEDNSQDASAQNFEGTFCFDLPLEIADIANHFEHFDEVVQESYDEGNELLHSTTFTMDFGFDELSGELDYFLDEYDNTCTNVTVFYEESGDEEEYYGEDPDTMVSEEELAAMEDFEVNPDADADAGTDRTRSLPDSYETTLNKYREHNDIEDMDFDAADVLSVRDKIRSSELQMLHLANGYPTIFPYEWYLLKKEEDHSSGAWTGTFCTDTSMSQAITKHNDMLANLQADIIQFEVNGSPQVNEKGSVAFAFNDIYGTGSWSGDTLFYIDRSDTDQVHKCAKVSMEFSPEVLQ